MKPCLERLSRRSGLCILSLAALFFLPASASHAQTVVASTSLTAAVAKAAGASEVRVLTPADVKHPPEYELRPSDILKLDGAQAVVFAGYERMVPKLLETSGAKNVQVLKVDTATSPENLILQTRRVAQALHTEKAQALWEKTFKARLAILKEGLASVAGKRAIVVAHAEPFARWAGLDVIQVVSPGELSVKALTEAVAKGPDVVIDILHMPAARVIADNVKSRYVQIINFPGPAGTVTLEDVFEFNASQLIKAFH